MLRTTTPVLLRRAGAELALLLAVGLFLAVLGPFGTASLPFATRAGYWTTVIVGGGLIGIVVDTLLGRGLPGFWTRLVVCTTVMTPGVCLLVWSVARLVFATPHHSPAVNDLVFQVFIISLAVMALRQLAWRGVWTERATQDSTEQGSDEQAERFRQRLSARLRQARLLAVEADDHYLRVHTDAGAELITLGIGEAVEELATLPGFRTHRSWWVAAAAIEAARWRRGSGELRLAGGLVAPVSRANAARLKDAGWF